MFLLLLLLFFFFKNENPTYAGSEKPCKKKYYSTVYF